MMLTICQDLEAISLASVQLQTSKPFKRVLEIVLAVGNHMNAGNIRVGGAVGFRITFLTQARYCNWGEGGRIEMSISFLLPSLLFFPLPPSPLTVESSPYIRQSLVPPAISGGNSGEKVSSSSGVYHRP